MPLKDKIDNYILTGCNVNTNVQISFHLIMEPLAGTERVVPE